MNAHADWKEVAMPAGIAALRKTGQGYPIPFVNLVYANGEADLRILDDAKANRCVNERLCAICGLRLGPEVVFVGGEVCFENHWFSDPAMHEECARYAVKVCPFLACQNYHHSRVEEPRHREPGLVLVANPLAPPAGDKRPERMMMYFTHGFKWVIKRGGVKLIEAYSPRKVEWF